MGANGDGFHVATSQGPIRRRALVLARGACALPVVPALSSAVPPDVVQTTASDYKRPDDLPEGGVLVVGAAPAGMLGHMPGDLQGLLAPFAHHYSDFMRDADDAIGRLRRNIRVIARRL